MPLVEPGGTCPSPGGCNSCPDRTYCACLRVSLGITDLDDEFGEDRGVFDITVIDRNTPIEEI